MKTCKICREQKREEMFTRRCSTCKECKKLGNVVVIAIPNMYYGYKPYTPRQKMPKPTVPEAFPSDINILRYL